jgi:cation transport ATPase
MIKHVFLSVWAECLPDEKKDAVRKIAQENHKL